MKFDIFALPTIPATLEDREALRPIGRNNERYQQMLEQLRTMVIMAGFPTLKPSSTSARFTRKKPPPWGETWHWDRA